MYQKSKEQKGFTLVEMIVVLVIIAILAAITIPALLKYIDKAKDKQLVINARTAYLAAETAASEAYAAGYTDSSNGFIFKNESNNGTGNLKTVQENATNLTGISKNYTCTITTDGNWKIKRVVFEDTSSSKGKKATLEIASATSTSGSAVSGSDWKVENR